MLFFKESVMKTLATFSMHWLPTAKAGMAIATVCLAGQVLAQATPNALTVDGVVAGQARPAATPDDRAKRPQQHREVRRGPVKPQHYPSNPQPPLPPRR
jgi:hypothetical protein